METSHRYLVTILLAAILSLPFLSRGLYETSEGRYAKVAQNMTDSGNYFVPELDGVPHLTKPPLTYWTIAAGMKVLGENTKGARLFHALLWILLSVMIVKCGDLLHSPKLGMIAGLIFTTSLFSSLGAMALTTDLLVTFFHALSFLAILLLRDKKCLRYACLFWLSVGLGFLTKGPVAFLVLPFFFLWMPREAVYLFTSMTWPIAIVTGLSWYIVLEMSEPGILRKMFYEEIYLRATTDFSGRNPFWWAPFAIYLPPLIIGLGAWMTGVSKKSRELFAEIFPFHWSAMLLCWIVGVLCFFMMVKSRLPLYVLPLTVPLTLLIAWSVLVSEKKVLVPLAVNFFFLFTVKTYFTFFHEHHQDSRYLAHQMRDLVGRKSKIHTYGDQPVFGLEFYRKRSFTHLSGPDPMRLALSDGDKYFFLKKQKVKWFLSHLPQEYGAKALRSFGKWELIEINRESVPTIGGTTPSESPSSRLKR